MVLEGIVRTYKETHPSTVAADEMQAIMQGSRDGAAACALTATTTEVITMRSLDNMVGCGFGFFLVVRERKKLSRSSS
jgi:hypothetical protein